MEIVYQFFKHISDNYGISLAMVFLFAVIILFGAYFLMKTFPEIISAYVEKKLLESTTDHKKRTIKRKNISPIINKKLSNLIVETNTDRALLFEFSNGTSNLAGLPFLFISATSESVSVGTQPVASIYQRINISLFSNFIIDLENKNYIFIDDVENIRDEYPFVYSFLKDMHVKSVMFYSIYGQEETLGFIMIATTKNRKIKKDKVMTTVVEYAQMISSALNYEDIDETLK